MGRARDKEKGGENGQKSIVTYLYYHSMTNDGTFAIALALCQCVSYWFYIRWTNVIDEVPEKQMTGPFELFFLAFK